MRRATTPRYVVWMAALFAMWALPVRAGVHLAMTPESLTVEPGMTLALELRVPVAGSAFNGYDAVVEYDTTALRFVPTAPTSLQQGPDMTGACGNTFHVFRAAADSLSIAHSLLCANLSLSGPAHVYTVRFQPRTSAGSTHVRLRRAQFFLAGTYVHPTSTADAFVRWGASTGSEAPAPANGPRISIRDNPGRGARWIDLASPAAGEQRLALYDSSGRRIRILDDGPRPAGSRSVHWDGLDARGAPVPAGFYLVRYEAAGHSARASLIRLP